MFGDMGHGFIMFLFALWMVLKEKSLGAKKGDDEVRTSEIMLLFSFGYFTYLLYSGEFYLAYVPDIKQIL